MTNKIIQQLEAEQMSKEIPAFAPGDTVVVQVKVKEGTRERLQAYVLSRPTARWSTAWPSSVAVTYAKPSCTTCVTCPVRQHVSRKNWAKPQLPYEKQPSGCFLRFWAE